MSCQSSTVERCVEVLLSYEVRHRGYALSPRSNLVNHDYSCDESVGANTSLAERTIGVIESKTSK